MPARAGAAGPARATPDGIRTSLPRPFLLNFFRSTELRPIFDALPLVAIDIGSRGGIEPELAPIAWAVCAWGFEPDERECERLRGGDPGPWRELHHLPVAIAGSSGTRELHIPRSPAGASLLEHDAEVGRTFAYGDLFAVEKTCRVSTLELDVAIARYGIPPPSFLKLDVEGAELEILQGAGEALRHAVAVKTEVAFLPQRRNQPLAADVAAFLEQRGFLLMDFREPHRWRRYATTGAPYSARARIPFSAGQLAQGDYLFLRQPRALSSEDAAGLEQHVRAALLALCFGFFDHAYALLEGGPVRAFLARRFPLDPLPALERASRRYGQQVAWRAAWRNVRDLIPLARSILRTLPR